MGPSIENAACLLGPDELAVGVVRAPLLEVERPPSVALRL